MEKKEVFISYKSEDFDQANWLKSVLETNGISCWMAPSSIPGGSSYAREIPQAIENCRVFVVVLTKRCQNSIWVPKELDRALNCKKPVMPFVLENCELTDDFNFYLSNVQRYSAYQNKMEAAEQMLRDIRALLQVAQEPIRPVPAPPVQKPAKKSKKPLYAVIAAVAVLCVLAALILSGPTRVDAFQDLEVTLEGAAPYVHVTLTNNSPDPFLQSIHYTVTPESDLDLGDRFTVTVNLSKEDAKQQGYKLKSYTKEYTVEDVPSYVSDPSLLTAADVAALREKAELFINGRGEGYPTIQHEDGSESDLSADLLATCMTDFAFLEKGFVCTEDDILSTQKTLILPFCLSLDDVPYNWVDNQYHEEPVLVDYPALYGFFCLQNIMMDENGNLMKEGSFGIEISNLFENRSVMEMTISKQHACGEMVSGLLPVE